MKKISTLEISLLGFLTVLVASAVTMSNFGKLKSQNSELMEQNQRLSKERADLLAKRYPNLRYLRKGENTGERYIKHFIRNGRMVYVQLKNAAGYSVRPKFKIVLLDKFGVESGSVHCAWAFHRLNPGEEKNEDLYLSKGIGRDPVFYLIRFD